MNAKTSSIAPLTGLRRPRFSLPELYRHGLGPPSPLLMGWPSREG